MRISDERIETGGNSLDWCYVMLMCHEGRPERSTSRVKSVCNVVKKMKMEACWVAGRMTDQNEEEKREKLVALMGLGYMKELVDISPVQLT